MSRSSENEGTASEETVNEGIKAFSDHLTTRLMSASQLRIVPFSNAPDQDLEEWLQQYEFAAYGAGWDKNRMVERIGAYLAGAARAWYIDNIKESQVEYTYDQVVLMMRHDFLSSGYSSYLREKVRRRKQGLYEGVANYIFVMRNLMGRMDKEGRICEIERVERVLEGMLPQIAAQVIPYEPQTFEELLDKAKLVEKGLRLEAKDGEHVNYVDVLEKPKSANQSKVESNDWPKIIESMNKTFSETMTKILNNHIQSLEEKSSSSKECNDYKKNNWQSRGQPYTQNRNVTRSRTGKAQCWVCGKVGHIAKACWNRKDKVNPVSHDEKNKIEKNKKGPEGEMCLQMMHERLNNGERPDIVYALVDILGREIKAIVDCGATITIIREDLVQECGLKIREYDGNKINVFTNHQLDPVGKTHVPLIITDSEGAQALIHVDAVVAKEAPAQLVIGNNVNFKLKGVIDLTIKAYRFKSGLSVKGESIIMACKACERSKGNMIHVKHDTKITPRSTAVIEVTAGNKTKLSEEVYLITTDQSQYSKNRIMIPNTVAKVIDGETQLTISNFGYEPKVLKKGTIVGLYEKINDTFLLIPVEHEVVKKPEYDHQNLKKISGPEEDSNIEVKMNIKKRTETESVNDGKANEVCYYIEKRSDKSLTSDEIESDCPCHEEVDRDLVSETSTEGLTEECKHMKIGEGYVNVGVTLNNTQIDKLRSLLERYITRFAFKPNQIGKTHLIEHEIKTGDAKPVRRGPYKCSLTERNIIQRQVDEYLEMGILSPTKSPWGAGVVLVKKSDGTSRFCCDWRPLNAVTEFDSYPMVDIEQTLMALRGCKFFSLFDLNKGYHQVPVKESDRIKTAVVTMDGCYQWNTMGMGMVGASATFQRLMDIVLSGLRFNTAICYIDDAIVFSYSDFDDHLKKIELVLTRFENANLTFKPEKCRFGLTRTRYLGHVVDAKGIAPDPEKIRQIQEKPIPKSVTEIRSFLGLAGYYRDFIPSFSVIAKPLTALTRKNARFIWSGECSEAFQKLKKLLSQSPVLAHFNPKLATELRCDASDNAIGVILVQKHKTGWKIVSCAARNLSETEQRYTVGEREMLAIVYGLKKFRCYLYGIEFTVVTDHANHTSMMHKLNPSDRVARWLLHCMDFKFKIVYRPGDRNRDVDDLSRYALDKAIHFEPTEILLMLVTEDKDITDPQKYTESLITSYPPLNLRNEQNDDPLCYSIINKLENSHVISNKESKRINKYVLINGILYRKLRSKTGDKYNTVIPKAMLRDIMYSLHEDPLSGHSSFRKTLDRARLRFYWPKMTKYIKKYCISCMDCQTKGYNNKLPAGLLQPIPVRGPWSRVGIDAVGPFKISNMGNKYILTATCYFTKYAEARAVPDISAETTARFIVDDIICRHGAVEELLSDLGRNFLAEVVEQMLKIVGTRHVRTTSYWPQCNGLDEKVNGILCRMISKYVSSSHKDWDEYLNMLRFAYNTQIQGTIKLSPFMVLYGRDVRLPLDIIMGEPVNRVDNPISYAKKLREIMPKIWMIVKQNIERAQNKQKIQYDKKHRDVSYKVGDLVWVYKPTRKKGLTDKLVHKNRGPFKVVEPYKKVNYIVEGIRGPKKREIHHVSKLSPCYTREALDSSSEERESEEEGEIEIEKVSSTQPRNRDSEDTQATEIYNVNENNAESEATEIYNVNENNAESEATEIYNMTGNSETPQSANQEEVIENPTLRRSTRVTRGIPAVRYSPIINMLTILTVMCLTCDAGFHKVPPIVWRNTGEPVLRGIQPVRMAIKYYSPCNLLKDQNLLPLGSQETLYSWCNDTFITHFLQPIGKICKAVEYESETMTMKNREKRFIIEIGLGILAISTAISVGLAATSMAQTTSLKDELHEMSKLSKILMENLKKVTENDKLEKLALKRLKEEITKVSNVMQDTVKTVEQLQRTLPNALIVMSMLGAQFTMTKNVLLGVTRRWKEHKIDPQLFNLFNVTLPCEDTCPLKYAQPQNCFIDEKEKLIIINFNLRVTQPNVHVLAADPFILVAMNKTTNKICTRVYKGPDLVIYDEKRDCIVPSKDSNFDFVNDITLRPDEVYCKKKQISSNENFWVEKQCEDMNEVLEDDVVQVKYGGDLNFVYCNMFKIKLYENLPTIECPDFVFSLPTNRSFSIGRLAYKFESIKINKDLKFVPEWSQRINFQMTHQIKELDIINDTKELDELIKSIDTSSPTYVFSGDMESTKMIGLGIIFIIALVSLYCFMNWKKKTEKHFKEQGKEKNTIESQETGNIEFQEVKINPKLSETKMETTSCMEKDRVRRHRVFRNASMKDKR